MPPEVHSAEEGLKLLTEIGQPDHGPGSVNVQDSRQTDSSENGLPLVATNRRWTLNVQFKVHI